MLRWTATALLACFATSVFAEGLPVTIGGPVVQVGGVATLSRMRVTTVQSPLESFVRWSVAAACRPSGSDRGASQV